MSLPLLRWEYNRYGKAEATPGLQQRESARGPTDRRTAPFPHREGSQPLTWVTIQDGPEVSASPPFSVPNLSR